LKPSNIGLMENIQKHITRHGTYVPGSNEVRYSSGQVEEELQIPLWKQQEINRAYHAKFPHLILKRGEWILDLKLAKLLPAPESSQEILSAKGE
jgi:hypothetical protein